MENTVYRGQEIKKEKNCLTPGFTYSMVMEHGIEFSSGDLAVIKELIDIYENAKKN